MSMASEATGPDRPGSEAFALREFIKILQSGNRPNTRRPQAVNRRDRSGAPEAQAQYGEELLEIGARVVQSTRPATEAAQVAGVLEGFQRKSEQHSEAIADKLDQHIEKSKPAAEKQEFDVNAVSAVVEKLVRNSSEFRYLRSTCTNLSNSLLDLRERIQGLEDQQEAHVADLQALLDEAA